MYHSKVLFICCLLLTLALLLGGCGGAQVSPAEVLDAMCATQKPLPAGKILIRSLPQENDRHLSDTLLAVTFGNGSLPPALDGVRDAACFFSYTQPCELAVFLCNSNNAAQNVAKMCLRRLDLLKVQYAHDAANQDCFENAAVVVRGKWVVLCVAPDPSAALRAFRRAV